MAHYITGNTVTIGVGPTARVIRRTAGIEIEKSVSQLKDKATVLLPLARGLVNKNKPSETVADWLSEGQEISISLSYEKLGQKWESLEFQGYVMRVHPTIPAKIECQDCTWALERTPLNRAFRNTTIKAVVQVLINEANSKFNAGLKLAFEIQDIPVTNQFRASNTNCLYALDQIRKNYGLQAMFVGKTLYIGLAYTRLSTTRDVNLNLGGNVIEHDLVYTDDDSQKLQITAIGFTPKGKQQQVTVPEGLQNPDRKITLVCNRRLDKEQLRTWAKKQLEKKRFEGYTGSLTCFLIPVINPNDTVVITDPYNAGRTGRYLAEEVKIKKYPGIRRTIKIGNRID